MEPTRMATVETKKRNKEEGGETGKRSEKGPVSGKKMLLTDLLEATHWAEESWRSQKRDPCSSCTFRRKKKSHNVLEKSTPWKRNRGQTKNVVGGNTVADTDRKPRLGKEDRRRGGFLKKKKKKP